MENELKTSAKQFYLKDKDGKKVTASKLDKGDLPTLFNKNKNVEDATDDFWKAWSWRLQDCLTLFSKLTTTEDYKLSNLNQRIEKQKGQNSFY